MTKKAEHEKRSNALLTELYGPLKTAREWLEDANIELENDLTHRDRFMLRAFTDNVVIGWPVQSSTVTAAGSALLCALKKVSHFQLDMASRGFFVRGAVTVGDVFIDEIVVFGPALLDAYDAERERAKSPRVILTASAARIEREFRANYPKAQSYPLSQYLQTDVDGRIFVNYLNAGFIDGERITRHRNVVAAKLKEFETDIPILRKYQWVAQYHDAFCAEHSKQFKQQKISTLSAP